MCKWHGEKRKTSAECSKPGLKRPTPHDLIPAWILHDAAAVVLHACHPNTCLGHAKPCLRTTITTKTNRKNKSHSDPKEKGGW